LLDAPKEVAGVVAFLASDDASFITCADVFVTCADIFVVGRLG
jgi:NAD(P)-dependent dehydrogenase (short-subunit alcohol dehydrogenase family)